MQQRDSSERDNVLNMYFFIFNLLFIIAFFNADGKVDRLCRDPECKERLCRGQTASLYFARENGFLSFKQGETVNIYGISSDSSDNLYLCEISGKRGFAPRDLITTLSKCDETKLIVAVHENDGETTDDSSLDNSINSENPIKKDEHPNGSSENEELTDKVSSKTLEESTVNTKIKDGEIIYNNTEEVQPETDETPSRVIHASTASESKPRESFTSTFLQQFLETQPEISETDVSSESVPSVISIDNIYIAPTPTTDSVSEETELKDIETTESSENMVQNSISNSPTVTVFDGTTITDGEDDFLEVVSTTEKKEDAFLSAKQRYHADEPYIYARLIHSTKLSEKNTITPSERNSENSVESSAHTEDILSSKNNPYSSDSIAVQMPSNTAHTQSSLDFSDVIGISKASENDYSSMKKENNEKNMLKENNETSTPDSIKEPEISINELNSAIPEVSVQDNSDSNNISSVAVTEAPNELEKTELNVEDVKKPKLINGEAEIAMKQKVAEDQKDNSYNNNDLNFHKDIHKNLNDKKNNEQIQTENEVTDEVKINSVSPGSTGWEVNSFSSLESSSDVISAIASNGLLLNSDIGEKWTDTSDLTEDASTVSPTASEVLYKDLNSQFFSLEVSKMFNSYSEGNEKYKMIHDSVGFLNDNESEQERHLENSEDNKQNKIISFHENDEKLEQEGEFEKKTNENNLGRTLPLIQSENSKLHEVKNHDSRNSVQDAQHNAGSTLGMVDDYIDTLRLYLQIIVDLLPEPVHSTILDLESQGVSPRVTVFTFIAALSSIFLIAFILLIKTRCKEKELLGYLCALEQKYFNVNTERNIIKENLEVISSQKSALETNLKEEQAKSEVIEDELEKVKSHNSVLLSSLEKYQSQVDLYKYSKSELQDVEKKLVEEKSILNQTLQDSQEKLSSLESHITNVELELQTTLSQKEDLANQEKLLRDRVAQLEESCSQLLEEARLWDCRVKELTSQTEEDKLKCDELQESIVSKDNEIEGLKIILKEFEVIQKLKENEEDSEVEKKIHQLLSATVDLRTANSENEHLKEMLTSEKAKIMDFEVKMAEANSMIEKLKINYNHALQDKTEAQTKLDVLSNYFKEKEMQLQKELGVQEAMRQMKEEDASSASRRVTLIEQENSSYKHQVASLKQEIEETERNFKNQLVSQEKKAHDNWVAARAAERKMEEAKQEAAQLRQRLTLLEREQESWAKKSFDGIVRPVPKRYLGPNGESPGLPLDTGMDSTDRLNPPFSRQMLDEADSSTTLPPDRPLPPPPLHPLDHIHPPPAHSLPMLAPHFFPLDPWRFPPPGPMPPFHPLESRMTPPDFEQTTPPRGNRSSPLFDRESDRLSNSPRDHSRDSRSASPPYSLPRFHNIPPPRPYGYPFHPPPPSSRLPFPPPMVHRREPLPPGHPDYRSDSRNTDPIVTSSPRGNIQNSPQRDKSSTAV